MILNGWYLTYIQKVRSKRTVRCPCVSTIIFEFDVVSGSLSGRIVDAETASCLSDLEGHSLPCLCKSCVTIFRSKGCYQKFVYQPCADTLDFLSCHMQYPWDFNSLLMLLISHKSLCWHADFLYFKNFLVLDRDSHSQTSFYQYIVCLGIQVHIGEDV